MSFHGPRIVRERPGHKNSEREGIFLYLKAGDPIKLLMPLLNPPGLATGHSHSGGSTFSTLSSLDTFQFQCTGNTVVDGT